MNMNETKAVQWTVRSAYAAAVLFAIHLITYFIAPIRDATTTSSLIPFTFVILIPSLVLLPLGLWLVGRLISQGEERKLGRVEQGEPPAPAFGRGKGR